MIKLKFIQYYTATVAVQYIPLPYVIRIRTVQ